VRNLVCELLTGLKDEVNKQRFNEELKTTTAVRHCWALIDQCPVSQQTHVMMMMTMSKCTTTETCFVVFVNVVSL